MVLEFLTGETLKERLNRYTDNRQLIPLREVIVIIQQICTAVAFAYKNGVIHRDIKLFNVIISTQGEAILTDFGIAKMVGIEEFTATGAVIGTAAYIYHPNKPRVKVSITAPIFMPSGLCFTKWSAARHPLKPIQSCH